MALAKRLTLISAGDHFINRNPMCKDCGDKHPDDRPLPPCDKCRERDLKFQAMRREQPACPWCASLPYGWNDRRHLYDCGAFVYNGEAAHALSHPGHACSTITDLRIQAWDLYDDLQQAEREARAEIRELEHELRQAEQDLGRW